LGETVDPGRESRLQKYSNEQIPQDEYRAFAVPGSVF